MRAGQDVILVPGRDPLDEVGGGHSSYVRAHARAVLALGFTPHLFCAGRDDATVETDFGIVHRRATWMRPVRQLLAGIYAPRLAAAIARFGAGRRGPLLIHGFGVWGCGGVLAAARLRAAGCEAIPIVSSYTTYEAESRSLVRFLGGHGWRARLRYRADHLWIRLAVSRWERAAYCGSSRVLLNYESVRRLVTDRYGAAARCVKLTYASEAAFLRAASGAPEREAEREAESAPEPESDFAPKFAAESDSEPAPKPLSEPASKLASELSPKPAPEPAPELDLPHLAALAPAGAPLIVAVSRHDPRKGGEVLLAALDLLRRQGVPFRACLLGGGRLLAEDRSRARRLGLGASVALPGEVPDSYPYLERAEIFVLPSRAEQSGSLALLEALQAGCAVVASAVDGIPEDVVDGVSALLVPPGDPAALAGALARLLAAPGLRRRLAAGARRLFAERFSAPAFAAALGEVYAELGVFPDGRRRDERM